MPEVAKLMNDPQEQVRNSVADATANSGSLGGLRALLTNPDKQIRRQTIQELGYGSFGEAAIPALAAALQDQAGSNSQQAADALARFGRRGLPALDSLEQAARNSPDQGTRMAAIAALGKIGPEAYASITSLSDAFHKSVTTPGSGRRALKSDSRTSATRRKAKIFSQIQHRKSISKAESAIIAACELTITYRGARCSQVQRT